MLYPEHRRRLCIGGQVRRNHFQRLPHELQPLGAARRGLNRPPLFNPSGFPVPSFLSQCIWARTGPEHRPHGLLQSLQSGSPQEVAGQLSSLFLRLIAVSHGQRSSSTRATSFAPLLRLAILSYFTAPESPHRSGCLGPITHTRAPPLPSTPPSGMPKQESMTVGFSTSSLKTRIRRPSSCRRGSRSSPQTPHLLRPFQVIPGRARSSAQEFL